MQTETIRKLLKERFGFDDFRPGQEMAVSALLEDRRLLCIQPTGYGKSLLYQLPALLLDGVTLVVSPLLALMRDQLDHLTRRFKIPAGSINSDQETEENDQVRRAALNGELKILFVAPEQLDNLNTRDFIDQLPIDLMVVDEAHCISTWGHDFRPSYRTIIRAAAHQLKRNPNLRILGLTATADARVEADIVAQFPSPDGRPARVLRAGMDRPNLTLSRCMVNGLAQKLAWLSDHLPKEQGCGILYCATREQTEVVAQFLQQRGLPVVAYHAGFDPEQKRRIQRSFIEGEARLIAATNALGMGIDKPDIRIIVHVDTPGSITAYYQEVGRAGRDGLPSKGVLLFDPADRKIQEHFIHSAQPTRADFETALLHLAPDEMGVWPSLSAIKIRTGLHPTRVTVILAELSEQGFVEKVRQGNKQVYHRIDRPGTPDLSRYERQYRVRTTELNHMMAYGAGESGCLMQTLRKALGDEQADPCGRCNACWPEPPTNPEIGTATREAELWLDARNVVIPASKIPLMEAGLALLNGDHKSPAFVSFMRRRATAPQLDPFLAELLDQRLDELMKRYTFSQVLPLPSRTWAQQDHVAELLGRRSGAAVARVLVWSPEPETRQGTLFNNDQRKNNVAGKMVLEGWEAPKTGALLLLDDYVGSLLTLREAVRCLRKRGGFKGPIVPLAMAKIRWRLGAPGFL